MFDVDMYGEIGADLAALNSIANDVRLRLS